jgi:hypothetical protein
MKKLILTESQMKTLISKVSNKKTLNEGVSDQYSRKVEVNIYVGNSTFKGKEINDVSRYDMTISYGIEIEAREWGIKDILLYDIKGDDNLEIEVEYFLDENNTDTEMVTIPIDWDTLETESNTGEGVVTVGDTLDVNLTNDANGNLIIRKMSLPVYKL